MSVIPAVEGAGSNRSRKGLLAAGTANKLLPKPKTSHPYVVGAVLITVGLFGIIGSITGALPSMIAALFVPDALENAQGTSASPSLFSVLGLGSNTVSGSLLNSQFNPFGFTGL